MNRIANTNRRHLTLTPPPSPQCTALGLFCVKKPHHRAQNEVPCMLTMAERIVLDPYVRYIYICHVGRVATAMRHSSAFNINQFFATNPPNLLGSRCERTHSMWSFHQMQATLSGCLKVRKKRNPKYSTVGHTVFITIFLTYLRRLR